MEAAVADTYARSPEAAAALDGWESGQAHALVAAAAADGRLPGLASALWTVRPPGWEFGLGLAVAAFEAGRTEDSVADQVRSLEELVANLEEAKRRAEVGRAAAEAQAGTLDTQLKESRRARRRGEERVIAELAETRARVEELEAELAEAVRRRGEAEAQFKAEARRAAAEQKARTEAERTAAESAAAPPEPVPPPPPPGPDPVLAEAAQAAARLAEAIEGTARLAVELGELLTPGGAGPPSSDAVSAIEEPPPRPARPKRARVLVPPGMMADTPEAAETMVRTPGLAVVVDGYNVSMLAWPEAPVAEQRERLFGALTEFQLRTRVGVTLVFDGANVPGVRPPRRPGLRVVFSAAGQEADEVVVEEVAARPLEVPVLVISSDAWVRDRAEALGAQVLPSTIFLALLRR
jgi:hypothetical protein